MVWASSIRMPKLLQPSPISLTFRPLSPSRRNSMPRSPKLAAETGLPPINALSSPPPGQRAPLQGLEKQMDHGGHQGKRHDGGEHVGGAQAVSGLQDPPGQALRPARSGHELGHHRPD